jgi:hypothetical protein
MKKGFLMLYFMIMAAVAVSQDFEESAKGVMYDGKPAVRVGADFAMQYQGLKHHADSELIALGKGINLPTANLNIDAVLAEGIELNLVTYLSSRHHVESWVKGGYLLVDRLPFINSSLVDNIMNYMTFKVGVMEINYGDAHFRRSDNGKVISNRFVGNNIIDAFTTSPAFEALFRDKGILLMGAVSTGSLKPALSGYNAASKKYTAYNMGDELAFYWKAGYDKEINEDFRLRATVSGYHAPNHHFGSLYDGDRAGSRFYLVMNRVTNSANDVDPSMNHLSGNWGPGFTDRNNSIMANLLARYKGLEIFGTYESVKGTSAFGGAKFGFSQFAVEGLYFFGKEEQFFGGIRYNYASKDNTDDSINRTETGLGWFITPQILVKMEYADQNYKNFSLYGKNGGFDGLMIEAAVSF